MGEWRNQQFEGGQRRRRGSARWGPQNRDSNWSWSYGKPPRIPDELQVPRWEVDFCRYEGMTWHKLLEAKQFTHLYDNILNWNDSEGEQAFRNAKARYWARINGFESDIPVPDPEMYIDKVDQDEIIEQSVYDDLSDIERENPCGNNSENFVKGEGESVIIWGDFFLTHQTGWDCSDLPVIPTGWGDPPGPSGPVIPTLWGEITNENKREGKIIPTGWGDAETKWNVNESDNNGGNYGNCNNNYGDMETKWNVNESNNNGGNYGNCNNNYGHAWPNEDYYWDVKGHESYDNHDVCGNWGGWNKKRGNGSGNVNWNGNREKRWRKKHNSNGVSNEDKSRLFCSRDNGSTRYNDGWNMQRRTVT